MTAQPSPPPSSGSASSSAGAAPLSPTATVLPGAVPGVSSASSVSSGRPTYNATTIISPRPTVSGGTGGSGSNGSSASGSKTGISWQFVRRWLMLTLPIWALLFVATWVLWNLYTEAIMRETQRGITEMLELEVALAKRSVQNLASDLLVISDASEIPMMEGSPEEQELAIDALKKDFVSLGIHKRFYDQLRFIDRTGMERVRVNFERFQPRIVPDGELQSKAGRYFVKETLALKPGEIFITPLDLSIEWGHIELVDGHYKPMIRFCSPVFTPAERVKPDGKPFGIITISYLPEQNMLRDMRDLAAPSPGDLFLLNEDSYWLMAPNQGLEWAWMDKELKAVGIERRNVKFADRYPDAWEKIGKEDIGEFYTSDGYFVFATVSPLDALRTLNPNLKYKGYNWKFVNFISTAALADILSSRWHVLQGGLTAAAVAAVVAWFLTGSRMRREQAEADLRAEQIESQKLALVASRTDNAVIILDKEKRVDWVNEGFHRMIGYAMDEVKGKAMAHIMKGPEYSREGIAATLDAIERTIPVQAELLLDTKEGFPLWVFMDAQPAYDDSGAYSNYIIVNADVTSQKLAEEEARAARQTAETANQAKSEFLANMSHELRTPMNAILGFSDLLAGMVQEGKQKSYLQAIASSGRSLLTLINDILDLSKIEAGKLEFQYEPSSVRNLLNEIKHIFSAKASEKSLYLNTDIPDDVPGGLLLDEVRIRQILFNVIGNALKFTEKGGITVVVRTTIKEDDETKVDLLFEVTDTGIGIPADQVDRIFSAFTQVSGQSTRKYGGTGLGLTITKRLTEMMGGKISVRSRSGEGSTFSFFFPNVTVTAFQDNGLGDAASIRVDQFKPAKIVVADDVDLNRMLIAGYFEGSKHTLYMAENGREAVELTQEHKPAIILMDVRMPEMDGVEASLAIRKIDELKHIPIIAVTASVLKHQEDEVREVVDGFLAKPVSKRDLVEMMKKYLPLEEISPEEAAAAEAEAAGGAHAHVDAGAGDPELWPKLLDLLRDAETGTVPGLIQHQKMGEIETFCGTLTEWAEAYKAPALGKYSADLLEQVQLFDLDAMAQTLEKFPAQVAAVAAFVEKKDEPPATGAASAPSPAKTASVVPGPTASIAPAATASTAGTSPAPAAPAAAGEPGDSASTLGVTPGRNTDSAMTGLFASAPPAPSSRVADSVPPGAPTRFGGKAVGLSAPAPDGTPARPAAGAVVMPTEVTVSSLLPGADGAGAPPTSVAQADPAAEWAGLIYQLRADRAGTWSELVKSQMLGEIETFGARLRDMGTEYNAATLTAYGKKLIAQAEEFDLDNLPATLNEFPDLIEALSAQHKAAIMNAPPTGASVLPTPATRPTGDIAPAQPKGLSAPPPPPKVVDPALAERLTELRETSYKRLRESQLMGEVESFARDIISLGVEHSCKPLKDYGAQLLEASDLFDVDLINAKLDEFPALYKTLT